VLRYFNVFGQRQNPNSQYAAVIPIFINSFMESKSPTIYGDGEQSRDFIFVEDVVRANLLACYAKDSPGEVFNIACGGCTTINSLVRLIKELIDSDIKPVYEEEHKGDIRHSQADISKALRILKYEPKVDMETGLERTVEWFRANIFEKSLENK